MSWAFTSLFALIELGNIFEECTAYFKRFVNWTDIARILIIYGCLVVQTLELEDAHEYLYFMLPIMYGLCWFKLIFVYLGVFKAIRYFLHMINVIFVDIAPFMIILLVTMLASTHLNFVVVKQSYFIGEVDDDEFQEDGDMFVGMSKDAYALSLGETPDYGDLLNLHFFVFLVFSFLIPLVLMNLLIAIMSDSYEKV